MVKVSFPVSHLLRNAGVAQKFGIFKKSCSGGLGWLCSGQGGTKPVQDRAAHRAGKQNDVMMGTNLSAEGSGEQRKTDLSWNLVPRCQVRGSCSHLLGNTNSLISMEGMMVLLLLSAVSSPCAVFA